MAANGKSKAALELARLLGWFSIGLGAAELLASRKVSRAVGLRGMAGTVRAYGFREITAGVGILTESDPTNWVRARIAGDVVDLATLAVGFVRGEPARAAGSIAMVGAVTALDVYCAAQLAKPMTNRHAQTYSRRSGLGHVRRQAPRMATPREYAIPEALRPWT
jgi:hypothetical protein